ncbi:hypothetical protein KQH82_03055 [bacterium]|nr:hypothetical protein [bacterium]
MGYAVRIGYALLGVWLVLASGIVGQDMPHEVMTLDCENCHTTETFTDVAFDHAKVTGFVLSGRHGGLDCRSCHSLKDFSKVGTDCGSCHKDVHEAKLGTDCARCHSPEGWQVFDMFQVHLDTDAPIMGRHVTLDCESCHTGFPRGDLSHTDARCVACHQSDYLETTSPSHVVAGFSTDCEMCHQMNTFRPAMLPDHDIFFPIYSGEHDGTWSTCGTCHPNDNNFADFTCLVCHEHRQSEMDETHAGFDGYAYNSDDCYLCHPRGVAEDFGEHDALYFPVFSGSHQGEWESCSACHNVPLNRSVFDCLSCHEHAQVEMDGKHGDMSGYAYESTACYECHPTGVKGEFTAHDAEFFPIFSGAHSGEWDDCATCHTVENDRSQFECIVCHEHEQAEMDGVHGSMTGYSFSSAACYDCHPTGVAEDFTAHDAEFFPIFSGTHNNEWDACSNCHTVPLDRSIFDCLGCHEHAQAEMDGTHGDMTGYSYSSTACYDCHPTGEKGEFTAHDAEFFPIFSGRHAGEWDDCSTCHTVPLDRSQFTCFSCHAHDQAETDGHHIGEVQDYVYESSACYECHPDGRAEDD